MLRLETLGALRLSRDGVELLSTASQPRRLLLLAVVAGSGDLGIPRARLLALLWPESDESHARNALKQALFSLRRDLGLDVMTGPATLKLDPGTCTSDVGEMLSSAARSDADRVISLDRGPFLDGIFGGDSPGLEEWIAATRLRVDEAVEAAFGKLASLAAARGVHAEAAHHLASLALRRPLDSAVAMRLIRALEAGGDAAAALMSAERHEAALWRELQLTPDPAFIALMRDVRERAARATIDAVTTGAPPPVRHEGRAAEPAAPPASLARSRAEPQRATRFLFMGALAIVAVVAAVSWSPERRSRGLELADARVRLEPFSSSGADSALARSVAALVQSTADALSLVHAPGRPSLRIVSRAGSPRELGARDARGDAAAEWIIRGSVAEQDGMTTLSASLVDAHDGRTTATATATGPHARLAALALRVTVSALEPLLDARTRALVRADAIESANFGAVESYLKGISSLLGRRYEEAIGHFQGAVRADSGFAMAWYRLSVACDWASQVACWIASSRRAGALADQLPERHRLLLDGYRVFPVDHDEAERVFTRLVTRFPDDGEGWFRLGEIHFHFNPLRGRRPEQAREEFERALRLVPGETEILEHLARLAALRHDTLALDTLTANAAAAGDTASDSQLRLFGTLMGRDDRAREALIVRLESLDEFTVNIAIERVMMYGGSLAFGDRLYRRLEEHAPTPVTRAYATLERAIVAAARGRMADALAQLQRAEPTAPAEARSLWRFLASIPHLELPPPPPELDSPGEVTLRADREPLLWYFRGGPRAWRPAIATALDGQRVHDVGAWDRAILIARTSVPADTVHQPWHLAVFRAGRGVASGHMTEPAPPEAYDAAFLFTRTLGRWVRAEAFRARGRLDEAAATFGSFDFVPAYEIAWAAPAQYERGLLLERLGRAPQAAAAFRAVEDRWTDADGPMRALVADARARRTRLEAAR